MISHPHLTLKEVKLPPGSEWHYDGPGWYFLRISDGTGYWIQKGSAQELEPGDVLVIMPGATGYLRVSQLARLKFNYFPLCPQLLGGVLSVPERRFFRVFPAQAKPGVRFVSQRNPKAKRFAEVCIGGGEKSLMHRAKMLLLVAELLDEEIRSYQPPANESAPAIDRFKQIIGGMPENELIQSTVRDLARRCDCSVRHFNRLFREHFGVSIRSKLTELRLQKAQQLLLANTDSRIINVAMDCGYQYLSLFNASFKKYFGMTPSQWRLKNAKNTKSAGQKGTSTINETSNNL